MLKTHSSVHTTFYLLNCFSLFCICGLAIGAAVVYIYRHDVNSGLEVFAHDDSFIYFDDDDDDDDDDDVGWRRQIIN